MKKKATLGKADEEESVRGFYRLTDLTAGRSPAPRLYSGPAVEIEFGLFYKGGSSTAGEIFVTWEKGGAENVLRPRLHAHGDGFAALWQLRQVLRALSTRPNVSPDELCALLMRLGFTDFTVRETAWLAHAPSGSFFRIHEGFFETAPMSAGEDAAEPHTEEVTKVDYDEATRCGETDLVELRAIEVALRSGATSLDNLDEYKAGASGKHRRSR